MDYAPLTEGSTRLLCPKDGGVSSSEEVFYNPHMALNRDLTVALCILEKPKTFLDVMAASGARGVRVANEAGVAVTLNDLNPHAVELIRENASLNDVEVSVSSEDARKILASSRFDYVDLDPFGPPVEYADAAVTSVRHNGVLGVCATDTSALCGTYPSACIRKYDSQSLKCDCYNEVGLRILLGFIARTSMRHGLGIHPIFSHSTRHYMRAQVRITRAHKQTQSQLGYMQYCFSCMRRVFRKLNELETSCSCGGRLLTAGPLWVGQFADEKTCVGLHEIISSGEFARQKEALKLIGLVSCEQAIPTPYYDLHKMCKKTITSSPKMERFEHEITSRGFAFARTHFCDTGLRSDMPSVDMMKLLKDIG